MPLSRLIAGMTLAVLAVACRGSSAPSRVITSLIVTGTSTFSPGQSSQMTALAMFSDGSSEAVTSSSQWSTSNAAVATVSSTGYMTANSIGQADVQARYMAVAGGLHVTVTTGMGGGSGAACGDERWEVKTLTDPDATRVDFNTVVTTTVTALNNLTPRCANLPDPRTYPEEFRVYEVVGRVTLTRLEDDHDQHVVLADPNDATQTIVTEVADPACAVSSPYVADLQTARAQFQSQSPLVGKLVRVRGVGFYDFAHGQTGRSRSCIELHPILNITTLAGISQ